LSLDERVRSLPIFVRTSMCLVLVIGIADAAFLLYPVEERGSPPPLHLDDIARSLAGQNERGGPPPPPNEPPGGRGGSPPGQPGSPGGPPPPPRDSMRIMTSAGIPTPPGSRFRPSPKVAERIAALLQVPAGRVLAYATDGDVLASDDTLNPSLGELRVALQAGDATWRIADLKGSSGFSARRLAWIAAIEILTVIVVGGLFSASISSPLRRIAQTANAADHDLVPGQLTREGPSEILAVIDAVNGVRARLNRLIHERTQMVAAIAHDLRTPLTRLAFRLDDLPGPSGEKVRSDIEEMKHMIAAALDFIRDRSLKGQQERLDFRLLVERVAEEQSDLGHDVEFASGPPVTIHGIPLALRRAVTNLVENAVKYGDRARLKLVTRDSECVLDVEDDGPGIPEALQIQVFDPFFRIESSRNRNTGGIGLGLAAVRATALEHGGDITIANRRSGGLKATLTLPLSN
jgi:two-component system, OmpR family, sensor kinase